MHPTILCVQCGRAVTARSDLAVGGRWLQPLHSACYREYAAAQPWYRKPGWPVNRWRSLLWFILLVAGFALLLHLTIAPLAPSRVGGLALILAIVTGWQLIGRLLSYLTLERHLPR